MKGGGAPATVARRVVLVVAIAVAALGAVQAIAGAVDSGITIDEPTHTQRTQGWLEDGWYLPPTFLEEGEPMSGSAANPSLYGPAFATLAQTATFATGLAPIDEVATSAASWTVRHLLTALLGLLTALVAGLGVLTITRSRLFAVWTVAALLATPIWLGMSFFNPKDIPVAAGYTFVTVGLIFALAAGRSRSGLERSSGIGVAVLLAAGVYLAVGTRLALWVPVLAAAGLYLALALLAHRGERVGKLGLGYVAAGLGVGVLALVLVYPAVFAHPLAALSDSVEGSSSFPWSGVTLTAGRLVDETPPLWYLPVWTAASVPFLIVALASAGLIVSAARALRHGAGERGREAGALTRFARNPASSVSLIALQALMLPVGSAVIGATMYAGIRQFLFVVPAIAMLAGLGAGWLWRIAEHRREGRWRPAAAVVLCLALIVPMLEQTLLFPYNYTYVSMPAGIGGVNERWETDYWWASSRDAYARVPAGAEPVCVSASPAFRRSGLSEAPPCLAAFARYLQPYEDERLPAKQALGDEQWVLARHRAGNRPPAWCDSSPSVTRWLRGEEVVMSYVMRCPGANRHAAVAAHAASSASR